MKKLLIIMGLLSGVAQAEITVVNPSNKASPATVFATAYKDALGQDTKFYQASTCEDAQKVFDKTKDAVMVYNSSIEFAARDKGLNCGLKANAVNTVYIGKQYMSLCTLKDSGVSLTNDKITLGMTSMYATKTHQADLRSVGINTTLVPYGGSKDIVTAVLNKDISAGYISSSMVDKNKDLVCSYQTNPDLPNYIGKSFKLKVPDFRITYVVYTNTTDPKVMDSLLAAQSNQSFSEYLKTSGTISNWAARLSDIDSVKSYVDRLFDNWSFHSEIFTN